MKFTRLLLFVPWIVLFVYLVDTAWFICDDAFISFRYVRNLVDGYGLVFNEGEYVEGYSNFLWVLELAAIWKFFGIRPEVASLVLSVFLTVATVGAMLSLSRHRDWMVSWMAIGLLCTSSTFAVWTSGGLETRQFTFFIVLAVALLAQKQRSEFLLIAASLSLGAAELTRPEGLMLGGLAIIWYGVDALLLRQFSMRRLLKISLPFTAIVFGHFAFRWGYYNELLPNTYYAKHVRPWYESGVRYLSAVSLETGLYLLLPLAVLGAWKVWKKERNSIHFLSLLFLVFHINYLIRIGGDHFEFRPLDFYWPLLAVPSSIALVALFGRINIKSRRTGVPWNRGMVLGAYVMVVLYCSVPQVLILLESAKVSGRKETKSYHLELSAEQVGGWSWLPGMSLIVQASNQYRQRLMTNLVGLRRVEHGEFGQHLIRTWQPAEDLKEQRVLLPKSAVYPLGTVGIVPYYLYGLTVIDMFGLVDHTVARIPESDVRPNETRQMAHDKRVKPAYLRERGVSFFPKAPCGTTADPCGAKKALRRSNYALQIDSSRWLPFDANDALWVQQDFQDKGVIATQVWSVSNPEDNHLLQNGKRYVGERVLFDFEEGTNEWTGDRQSFSTDPARQTHLLPFIRTVGTYLTSSVSASDSRTGMLRSPFFSVTENQVLVFKFFRTDTSCQLNLLSDNRVVHSWDLAPKRKRFGVYMPDTIVFDTSKYSGESLQLELVDASKSGFMMIDHVVLMRSVKSGEQPFFRLEEDKK